MEIEIERERESLSREIGGIRDPPLSVRSNLREFILWNEILLISVSVRYGCAYIKYVFGETGIGSDPATRMNGDNRCVLITYARAWVCTSSGNGVNSKNVAIM